MRIGGKSLTPLAESVCRVRSMRDGHMTKK
jgi:hypothetical protein